MGQFAVPPRLASCTQVTDWVQRVGVALDEAHAGKRRQPLEYRNGVVTNRDQVAEDQVLVGAAIRLDIGHDQKSVLDGSATRRQQQGVHAKNRATEEPNAGKLARSALKTSRSPRGTA